MTHIRILALLLAVTFIATGCETFQGQSTFCVAGRRIIPDAGWEKRLTRNEKNAITAHNRKHIRLCGRETYTRPW